VGGLGWPLRTGKKEQQQKATGRFHAEKILIFKVAANSEREQVASSFTFTKTPCYRTQP
jgi:hypothetical protein